MIGPLCFLCGEELDEPGAILLGPPTNNFYELVHKMHICVPCFNEDVAEMIGKAVRKRNG